MSIDKFVADPESYSKSHVVQFTHLAFPPAQAGMQPGVVMNNWAGAWTAVEYLPIAGQFPRFRFQEAGIKPDGSSAMQRIGKGADKLHTVMVGAGAADLGIRYLPWGADTVTYMQLDNAGQTFFTGPLSGCSIFIGVHGGTYWAFHSNRNNAGAHNPALKAAMTVSVVTRLPVPVRVLHAAAYGTDYSNFGFVFGKRSGAQWRFFVADTELIGPGRARTKVRRLR